MEVSKGVILPLPRKNKERVMYYGELAGDADICLNCKKKVCRGNRQCYEQRRREIRDDKD